MANVAILSSTTFQNSAQDGWFKSKMPAGTVYTYFNADGDYETNSTGKLKQVAANIPNSVNVIVTVGGLVAAEAAANLKKNSLPNTVFFSILGGRPKKNSALLTRPTQNIPLIGGIDLDTPNHNSERVALLQQYFPTAVTDPTKICLYCNGNSHMADDEMEDWEFHMGAKDLVSSVKQQGGYNAQQFKDDFNTFGQIQAVVVSSDPFFASKAADLIAAATAWNKPVCYPTEFYSGAQATTSLIYGPGLKAAFEALGTKVSKYISAPAGFMSVDKQPQSLLMQPLKSKHGK